MSTWNVRKIISYYLFATLIVSSSKVISEELVVQPEIWLLSGSECNVCETFDKTKEDRNYGNSITVQNIEFLIKKINKNDIPDNYKTLVDEIAKGNEYWPIQLNIAVTQGKTVLYHGNIAESADWRNGVIDQRHSNLLLMAYLYPLA